MTNTQAQILQCPLLALLQNSLILNHIAPYVGVVSLVSLGVTSTSFKDLIYGTPSVFQHIDLTKVISFERWSKSLCLPDSGDEEAATADEVYSRALRRVLQSLQSRKVLQDVRTLVLDGLTVPALALREILCDDSYNVRILSLRAVKELGDEKLIQILRYIIRPSRPEGTPKLKGLYYFTPIEATADFSAANVVQREPQTGVTTALGAQLGTPLSSGKLHKQLIQSCWHQSNPWYRAMGEVFRPDPSVEEQWAMLIQASEGLIAYDAVLCRHNAAQLSDAGSSRQIPIALDLKPKLATVSLGGCRSCNSCPEGPAYPETSAQNELPLLAPPPKHQSSVTVAQRLDTHGLSHPPFIARCRTCLKDRWCERCNFWWCESCYTVPSKRRQSVPSRASMTENESSIKVHNHLCVSKCLMDELLNGVGEGGMWG